MGIMKLIAFLMGLGIVMTGVAENTGWSRRYMDNDSDYDSSFDWDDDWDDDDWDWDDYDWDSLLSDYSAERQPWTGDLLSFEDFSERYSAGLGSDIQEMGASWSPGMVNVGFMADGHMSCTIRVNSHGEVTGFNVAVNLVNYGMPEDPSYVWEEMYPLMYVAMSAFGLGNEAWAELRDRDFVRYRDSEAFRSVIENGYTCSEDIGYTEWYDGLEHAILMSMSVDLETDRY